MKKLIRSLSIAQGIMASTLSVVIMMLIISSIILYALFSDTTNTLVETQSNEINKQIVLNYENYINSIIETANYLQLASLNSDVEVSYQIIQEIYRINSDLKKDLVSIFLFDLEGNRVLGDEIHPEKAKTLTSSLWFIETVKEKKIFHFTHAGDQSISRDKADQVISVSKFIEFTKGAKRVQGVLLLELNFQVITDLAGKTNLGEGGHILILEDDDSLIYSSGSYDQKRTRASEKIAVDEIMGSFSAIIDSVAMYMNISPLIQTRWRIVTVSNINDIATAKDRIIYILMVIVCLSILASAAIALFLSRGISKPLQQFRESMWEIEKGNFDTQVVASGQKEITDLANSFNSMIDRVHTLMQRVVNEQKEKRKTEFRALQNQINPHFLYNTLDSIVWLAENERSVDVITTVVALARFFRISISQGHTFIPVKDEIAHIKNYLTIQQIRYVEKFEYKFDIDKDIYDFQVMKLILQPIVENAIYHGVGDEKETITIRGYLEDGLLIFEIENTGYGITEDRIKAIYAMLEGTNPNSSVGMRNVYQRLKLYYGEEANIIISSTLDEMTNMKLIMPAIKREGV